MKYFAAFLILTIPFKSMAACQYNLDQKNSTINWTAFKTPKKVGVKAKFDKFLITSKDHSSIMNAIKSSTFTVDAGSVNTGMPARDTKIVKNFFTKGKELIKITGEVLKIEGDSAVVNLTFNDVQKPVIFKIKTEQNKAMLSGTIDVLDFALSPQLATLNEACKALHEGKTWSDVELVVEANFNKKCD